MLCILQPPSVLWLVDILLDGIEEADVGGQFGSHCFELILALNSWAAFGGPHSCTDVNRALGGFWLEEGQPPHSCKPQDNPHPAQRRKQQQLHFLCAVTRCWLGENTRPPPSFLPAPPWPRLPCECAGVNPHRSGSQLCPAGTWDAGASPESCGMLERAVLQAHRLLLFSGSAEEIFYVFIAAPCMLMRWPETNNLAIIVLPNAEKNHPG